MKRKGNNMKNNLRVILAKKRMKTKDLHVLTRIYRTTLTGIYYERTKPTVEVLLKIADVLNVTLDELIRVEE